MSDYPFRMLSALLASEMVPAGLRTILMRAFGFQITRATCIWAGAVLRSRKFSMGREVFVNVGFYHDGYDRLDIGDHVRIGPYVRVITATHDIGPHAQRGMVEVVGRPVRIGNGSWIGAGVTILPGVTIAEGCVVSANATVYDSTEPDGLYAGNPARRVRELEP